jgi:hypothetical protein
VEGQYTCVKFTRSQREAECTVYSQVHTQPVYCTVYPVYSCCSFFLSGPEGGVPHRGLNKMKNEVKMKMLENVKNTSNRRVQLSGKGRSGTGQLDSQSLLICAYCNFGAVRFVVLVFCSLPVSSLFLIQSLKLVPVVQLFWSVAKALVSGKLTIRRMSDSLQF